MSLRNALCALLMGAILGSAHAELHTPSLSGWGYVGWWMPQSWQRIQPGQFERLLFFELRVSKDGRISDHHGWPQDWTGLRQRASQLQIPLDLTLTLFSVDDFNALFTSVNSTRTLLETCLQLTAPYPGLGLHIDFEIFGGAETQAIENFRTFVHELGLRLRDSDGKHNLSVFLPANSASTLFDKPTLATFDQVVVQGYDTHWSGSKNAGPVAPLRGDDAWTWEKLIPFAASLGIPMQKTLISYPLFGYEWPVTGRKLRSATIGTGAPTTFAPVASNGDSDIQSSARARVREYGFKFDLVSASPYYQFRRGDGQYIEGWFEDWWSLDEKIDFAKAHAVHGLAFFVVGYDDFYLVNHFALRKYNGGLMQSTPSNDGLFERIKRDDPRGRIID